MKIKEIKLADLILIDNVRADGLDVDKVNEFARSMEKYGQRTPIEVNKRGEIIGGYHRYASAQLLKWESLSCIVTEEVEEDLEQQLRMIQSNLQTGRSAKDMKKMVEKCLDKMMSVSEIAEALILSEGRVHELLRIDTSVERIEVALNMDNPMSFKNLSLYSAFVKKEGARFSEEELNDFEQKCFTLSEKDLGKYRLKMLLEKEVSLLEEKDDYDKDKIYHAVPQFNMDRFNTKWKELLHRYEELVEIDGQERGLEVSKDPVMNAFLEIMGLTGEIYNTRCAEEKTAYGVRDVADKVKRAKLKKLNGDK